MSNESSSHPDKGCADELLREAAKSIRQLTFGDTEEQGWWVPEQRRANKVRERIEEFLNAYAPSHVVQNWRYIPANPPPNDTPIELLCADSSVARVDYYDGYGRFHDGRASNVGGIFWRPASAPSTTPRSGDTPRTEALRKLMGEIYEPDNAALDHMLEKYAGLERDFNDAMGGAAKLYEKLKQAQSVASAIEQKPIEILREWVEAWDADDFFKESAAKDKAAKLICRPDGGKQT